MITKQTIGFLIMCTMLLFSPATNSKNVNISTKIVTAYTVKLKVEKAKFLMLTNR